MWSTVGSAPLAGLPNSVLVLLTRVSIACWSASVMSQVSPPGQHAPPLQVSVIQPPPSGSGSNSSSGTALPPPAQLAVSHASRGAAPLSVTACCAVEPLPGDGGRLWQDTRMNTAAG